MIRQPGARVNPSKSTLSDLEYKLLEFLLHKGEGYTAKKVASWHYSNIRDIASSLSRLVGMDLVVSTEFTQTLTEAETMTFKTGPEPVYFIRKSDDDIYHRRAKNVVESAKGSLHNLEYIQPETNNMFPNRPDDKVVFTGVMTQFGNNDSMDGTEMVFETNDDIISLRDKITGQFRITVEPI